MVISEVKFMGHEFKFEVIPLAEAVREPQMPEETEQPVVLVVDDEPLIVDSLAAILGSSGFTVLKAYNGASALEVAMETPPHLLLTDVAMPGMNGIDLAMTVADALPACKVVLFSAHASTVDLRQSRAAGFDFALLAKPIHPLEMLKQVHFHLQSKPEQKRMSRPVESASSVLWRLPEVNRQTDISG
jgi:CheY-like chemotaxis protein